MNLRLQTDYALRVLLYLAHVDQQASVESMASAYGISKDHLFKVVQQLARLGYISSRGGRGGGVRLARDPQQINVGTVVAEMEGRGRALGCIHDPTVCVLEPGCILRNLVMKAEDAFFETLSKMTIADLVRGNVLKKSGGLYNLTISASASRPAQRGRPTRAHSSAKAQHPIDKEERSQTDMSQPPASL